MPTPEAYNHNPRALLAALRRTIGRRHVLTGARATARYRAGYRSGGGPALAVVRPGSLLELWSVAQACVAADVSIIVQAANTGLTGGSTPDGADYPGGVVIVSTARLSGIAVIRDGRQVVCGAGATLHQLERALRPYGREPHSVIGSSCIGASVVGGICNNSGGSLVQRGPAYTEMSLFAQGPPIYGGTDQIQRNIIGERVLGLPKEPEPDRDIPFRQARRS